MCNINSVYADMDGGVPFALAAAWTNTPAAPPVEEGENESDSEGDIHVQASGKEVNLHKEVIFNRASSSSRAACYSKGDSIYQAASYSKAAIINYP